MSSRMTPIVVLLFLASTTARCDLFHDRSFPISGTNFFFQFEDEFLCFSNKMRIAEDITNVRSFGVNSRIVFKPVDGFDGFIKDENIEDSPYFNSESLKLPCYFNVVNSTNMLVISKNLSDAYTNAFAFLDSNTNLYLSVRPFIESLTAERLDILPSNDVWRIVYYEDVNPAVYALARDEIVRSLKKQQYGFPSALSFHQTLPGTNGFPHSATWMRVPCLNWSSFDHKFLISVFHAFWYDGMWRLYPTEW